MNEILTTEIAPSTLHAFLELLKWIGHHYYIFLIVYLMILTHKASVKRDISYIEVWINGFTPRFLKKRKTDRTEKIDKKEENK